MAQSTIIFSLGRQNHPESLNKYLSICVSLWERSNSTHKCNDTIICFNTVYWWNPSSSLQLRQDQILKLEEEREKAKQTQIHHQKIIKSSFDSTSSSPKNFQIGDFVLKWDKVHKEKCKHTKFQKIWLGSFQIIEEIGPSTFLL